MKNASKINEVELQPRVLENVSKRHLNASFLGLDYGLPFGIAPMGMCNLIWLIWPGADRMLARAATEFDIPLCLSSAASSSIDDVAIAAPLTKYSNQITDGERIGEFVDRAWTAATTGYPGPVHLSLPVDLMFSSHDMDAGLDERPFARTARNVPRAWPDPAVLDRVLDLIRDAESPVIIGGHGIWWSGNEHKLEAAAAALISTLVGISHSSPRPTLPATAVRR